MKRLLLSLLILLCSALAASAHSLSRGNGLTSLEYNRLGQMRPRPDWVVAMGVPVVPITKYVRYGGNASCNGNFDVDFTSGTNCAYANPQPAFDAVTYSDTVQIEKGGAGFVGPLEEFDQPFYLPGKGTPPTDTEADRITVKSSGAASLPAPPARVCVGALPCAQTANMAKLLATTTGGAILFGIEGGTSTEKAAKWWKLEGLEITTNLQGDENSGGILVALGFGGIANNWIDRCYIHPIEDGDSTIFNRSASQGIGISGQFNAGLPPPTNTKITGTRVSGLGGGYKLAALSFSPDLVGVALGTNALTGLDIENSYFEGGYQPWFPAGVDALNTSSGTVQASPAPTLTSATLDDATGISEGEWITIEQTSTASPQFLAQAQVTGVVGNAITFTSAFNYINGGEAPIAGKKIYWDGAIGSNYEVTDSTFHIDGVLAKLMKVRTSTVKYNASASASTNEWTYTITAGTLSDGTEIWLEGDIPTGLDNFPTSYFVRDYDSPAGTFKIAATLGGTAIDITDDSTGTYIFTESGSNPKGFIEAKNWQNVLIEGCIFSGWPDKLAIQAGNQNGDSPWQGVTNVTIRNNWFKDYNVGFIINMGNPTGSDFHRSFLGENLVITNNLFTYTSTRAGTGQGLSGNMGFMGAGFTLTHNTMISNPADTNAFAPWFITNADTGATIANNIFQYAGGWTCPGGMVNCFAGFPDDVEERNVMINGAGTVSDATIAGIWPNSCVSSASSNPISFVGSNPLVLTDWVVSTARYKAGGACDSTTNTDNGADIAALDVALTGNDDYAAGSAGSVKCNWHTTPTCAAQ